MSRLPKHHQFQHKTSSDWSPTVATISCIDLYSIQIKQDLVICILSLQHFTDPGVLLLLVLLFRLPLYHISHQTDISNAAYYCSCYCWYCAIVCVLFVVLSLILIIPFTHLFVIAATATSSIVAVKLTHYWWWWRCCCYQCRCWRRCWRWRCCRFSIKGRYLSLLYVSCIPIDVMFDSIRFVVQNYLTKWRRPT